MSWMLTSGALETSALATHDSVIAACRRCQSVSSACIGVLTVVYVHPIVGHVGV